jgi:hypothetical protein
MRAENRKEAVGHFDIKKINLMAPTKVRLKPLTL